jgi:hypothetical protein
VRGELIATESHHLPIIEIGLLHQLAQPPVEKHVADLGLPAQTTLIQLLLHLPRTQRITQQTPPRSTLPQFSSKIVLRSCLGVALPSPFHILVSALKIDIFVEIAHGVFWRISPQNLMLGGRGRFGREDMRPAILLRLRVDIIRDVLLRPVLRNGVVLAIIQNRRELVCVVAGGNYSIMPFFGTRSRQTERGHREITIVAAHANEQ